MNRRTFLSASAAALAAGGACGSDDALPIIDTHVHLYDPTRPQGIPWPPKTNTLIYKKTLPDRLRQASAGLGVVGAIEVECSPWLEDNQWVLDVIEKDTIMVGTIGDIEASKPDFAKHLERFAKNPLFLGIRSGYLWDRDLRVNLGKPVFVENIRMLADRGLTLDTANQSVRALEDVITLTDWIPNLRVMLDHLPNLPVPPPGPDRTAYHAAMRKLGARPDVYVKVSAVLQHIGDTVPDDVEVYRAKLDEMWATFGEDRVVYGSDWPNSEPLGPYPKVLGVVRKYFGEKTRAQQEKYFWRNSVKAYRWKKRAADQPTGA